MGNVYAINPGLDTSPLSVLTIDDRNILDALAAILGPDYDGITIALAGKTSFTDIAAALGGIVPASLPVRRDQFLGALEASTAGRAATLLNLLPPFPDPANLAFWHGSSVPVGGVLATFTASALGLSGPTMASIFAAARVIPS